LANIEPDFSLLSIDKGKKQPDQEKQEMQPLHWEQIRGNWATLLLPIDKRDRIDWELLQQELDALIAFRVDGIYSCGTAGEFYNLTEAEFDRVSELLAMKCESASMPFQIGVSHPSPVISRERLQRSVHLAPGAVQVILPDWFPTSEEENIDFLRRMSECAGEIGLILYNPPHAKRVLSPDQLLRLQQAVPSLLGVKTAGGDADWYKQMKALLPNFSLFVAGHLLASGMRQGAHGAYSNVACLHPGAAQAWTDLMQTDLEAALAIEKRICSFMSECILPYITVQNYSNQAVDKFMASVGGWTRITPRLRWPYRSIPSAEIERQRKRGQELLAEFFAGSRSPEP